MDKIDLLMEIEKVAAMLRVYREVVMVAQNNQNIADDPAIKNAAKNLAKHANNLILPAGKPCSNCDGTGVEP